MRALTQREVAAMWLFHEDYAAQAHGASEFYAGLIPSKKRLIDDMLEQLSEADSEAATAAMSDLRQRVSELESQMVMLIDPTARGR